MTPGNVTTNMSAHDDEIPEPGSIIGGRYVVEGLLGKGGMSVVLRARDSRLGHVVALKLLRGADGRKSEHTRRFVREARTIAKLRSDHVVSVLDVDAEATPPYLAMELLEGRTLAELLADRGRFAPDVALRIMVQACRGVADAHAFGIIHRDLKPSNLLVARAPDGTQRVKVIDFGISKPLIEPDAQPALTSSGQILGSPRYMSPEQVRGGSRVDLRADIWALGAILYELVAGMSPFDAPTLADTLARIVRDTPTPLGDVAPDVPPRLAALVALCLAKEPALRPPEVGALLEELEAMTPPGPLVLETSDARGTPFPALGTTEWTGKRSWSLSLGPPRRAPLRLGVVLTILASLGLSSWLLARALLHPAPPVSAASAPVPPAAVAEITAEAAEPAPMPATATTTATAEPSAVAPVRLRPAGRLPAPARGAASNDRGKSDEDLGLDRRE